MTVLTAFGTTGIGAALAGMARPDARRRQPRDAACRIPGARPAPPATPVGVDSVEGGPSALGRVPIPGSGRSAPPGSNFEGRPLMPTVCANIETKNVAWKLPLPAYSGSTPIIWGDTIFLNVATGTNTGELELWAVDRNKQAVRWKRPLADANHMERKQNMSSPSPVTDGKHVWVMTGRRRPQGVRLRRQGDLGARHPGRLRQVRSQLGLRLVAAAARATRSTCRCCTA